MGNKLTILENRTWFNIEIKMWVDGSRPDRFRKIVRIKPGRSIRVRASTFNTDDDPECVMLTVYENGSWKGKYLLPQTLFAYAAVFCDRNQHGQVVLRAKRANFDLFRLKCFGCLPAKHVGLGMVEEEIKEIFKMTPHDKQVMMFSATLSKEIRPVCKKFMQYPMEIYVDNEAKLTLHGLVQHYIKLSELEKTRELNDLLDALDFNQVVIFVKSVNRAAELNKLLVECLPGLGCLTVVVSLFYSFTLLQAVDGG